MFRTVRRLGTVKVPASFVELEHTNWESGVAAYDAGFGPLTCQTIPMLLQKCQLNKACASFLDVATGPGYVLSAAIDVSPRACQFTGIDFSRNMIDLASKRLALFHPGTPVKFIEGDAENMPFPDRSFDCITCNFGILHLGNPDQFLEEAYRCLRPGGRLAFSVWAAPPATEAFALVLGAVAAAGNPDVPLPPGPPFFRFADPAEAARSLAAVGFVDVASATVEQSWSNIAGPAALYRVFLEGTARTRALLEGQTTAEAACVQAELVRRFAVSGSGGRALRMPAVVSSGMRPILPAAS